MKRNRIEEKTQRKPSSIEGKSIKTVHTIRSRFGLLMCSLFGAAGLITALIYYILGRFEFSQGLFQNETLLVIVMSLTWIGIGVIIIAATQRIWFTRVTKISQGMREIANGNYKVRMVEKDKKETVTELGDLEHTFNQMASELDGIEMFRSDFINNFSHEFKTPIVSIRGFARRLQNENLS